MLQLTITMFINVKKIFLQLVSWWKLINQLQKFTVSQLIFLLVSHSLFDIFFPFFFLSFSFSPLQYSSRLQNCGTHKRIRTVKKAAVKPSSCLLVYKLHIFLAINFSRVVEEGRGRGILFKRASHEGRFHALRRR